MARLNFWSTVTVPTSVLCGGFAGLGLDVCSHVILTVLTEGGQIRGGDQGPDRQTEGGEICRSLSEDFGRIYI